jgi:hypothetical protein
VFPFTVGEKSEDHCRLGHIQAGMTLIITTVPSLRELSQALVPVHIIITATHGPWKLCVHKTEECRLKLGYIEAVSNVIIRRLRRVLIRGGNKEERKGTVQFLWWSAFQIPRYRVLRYGLNIDLSARFYIFALSGLPRMTRVLHHILLLYHSPTLPDTLPTCPS